MSRYHPQLHWATFTGSFGTPTLPMVQHPNRASELPDRLLVAPNEPILWSLAVSSLGRLPLPRLLNPFTIPDCATDPRHGRPSSWNRISFKGLPSRATQPSVKQRKSVNLSCHSPKARCRCMHSLNMDIEGEATTSYLCGLRIYHIWSLRGNRSVDEPYMAYRGWCQRVLDGLEVRSMNAKIDLRESPSVFLGLSRARGDFHRTTYDTRQWPKIPGPETRDTESSAITPAGANR